MMALTICKCGNRQTLQYGVPKEPPELDGIGYESDQPCSKQEHLYLPWVNCPVGLTAHALTPTAAFHRVSMPLPELCLALTYATICATLSPMRPSGLTTSGSSALSKGSSVSSTIRGALSSSPSGSCRKVAVRVSVGSRAMAPLIILQVKTILRLRNQA